MCVCIRYRFQHYISILFERLVFFSDVLLLLSISWAEQRRQVIPFSPMGFYELTGYCFTYLHSLCSYTFPLCFDIFAVLVYKYFSLGIALRVCRVHMLAFFFHLAPVALVSRPFHYRAGRRRAVHRHGTPRVRSSPHHPIAASVDAHAPPSLHDPDS